MKAVIWTDVFQFLIMVGGIAAVMIKVSTEAFNYEKQENYLLAQYYGNKAKQQFVIALFNFFLMNVAWNRPYSTRCVVNAVWGEIMLPE